MKKLLFLLSFICHTALVVGQADFDQNASVKAANAFLGTLDATQKSVANLPFGDSSRVSWSNLPAESVARRGIQFKDLTDAQRMAIHRLLRTVLSQQGYQKLMFIIQSDQDIRERLSKALSAIAHRYGNQNYWLTVFGEPAADKIWAWKFEGHHFSLNMTYSPQGVTVTPMFVGINPALTTTGAYAGNHVMFEENDFGSQLFNSLSDDLKKKALLSAHPKDADVMTQVGKEAHLKDRKGVPYTEMNPQQQALVEKIARAWVENLTPALAEEKLKRILANKSNILFTWQGTYNTEELHYYSIKTDSFIIEYSNRDGGIYHYHTLWRDLSEDFLSK